MARRRVARGIGQPGFGNARDVRKLFERTVAEAKASYNPRTDDAPTLAAEHIIGRRPSPSSIPELACALHELDTVFVGLSKVKRAVHALVSDAQANWDLEMRGEGTTPPVLNRLFLGNPGTGKTSVAAVYGRVLKVSYSAWTSTGAMANTVGLISAPPCMSLQEAIMI